ncbi:hypothetical protein [Rubritalea tangerina]|uniref:hypothetical protein n=1 Tax=Rubritalea tangerina TaxID=430798 RepID=UPI00360BCFD0
MVLKSDNWARDSTHLSSNLCSTHPSLMWILKNTVGKMPSPIAIAGIRIISDKGMSF